MSSCFSFQNVKALFPATSLFFCNTTKPRMSQGCKASKISRWNNFGNLFTDHIGESKEIGPSTTDLLVPELKLEQAHSLEPLGVSCRRTHEPLMRVICFGMKTTAFSVCSENNTRFLHLQVVAGFKSDNNERCIHNSVQIAFLTVSESRTIIFDRKN